MADLNKVFLMGRLTFDPELRYTPNGTAVTDLRLATTRGWTGKDGERKEDTLFIDVTVWNRQAENCCQYLKKGRSIHVEGYLRSDSWEDKTTGEKRSKIKVEAERVQFLGGREDGGAGASDDDFAPTSTSVRDTSARRPTGPAAGSRGPAQPSNRDGYPAAGSPVARRPAMEPETESDDDIPF
jgi:single-strand DNA-binding protein